MKDDRFFCKRFDDDEYEGDIFIGYGNDLQNIIFIIISLLGIFINLYFFFSSIKRTINSRQSQKINVSSLEKILSIISLTETCISICWLINSLGMKNTRLILDRCDACRAIGVIELFFYIFDWMILSSTLFQIKKIITAPLDALKTEKNIYRYLLFCAIFGIINVIFGFYADVEGESPMLTCFIDVIGWDYDNSVENVIRTIFYVMFFLIPICILLLGIYKVVEIVKLPQYINNRNNRKFFKSYLQYICTYIILALLLISVYVFDYLIGQTVPSGVMRVYVIIVTYLSCSTPLIVGIIRLIKTKLLKKLFCCFNKNKGNESIDYCKDDLLTERKNNNDNDYQFVEFEQELICKEFKKIFIGISFILDKLNQINTEEEEETNKEKDEEKKDKEKLEFLNLKDNINNETDISNHYIINKQEILKNFDLDINEDLFVLDQEEINIEATEYCPNYFKNYRNDNNLKESQLVKFFQPKNVSPDLFKKTSDSNYYINSTNKQFILRSINLEQIQMYQNILIKGKINEYLENNLDSLINKVYGLYYLKIDNNKNYYIALMENIYETIEQDFSKAKNCNIKANDSDSIDMSIDLKKANNIEKKMYIYDNEINEKIIKMNDDVHDLETTVLERSFRKTLLRKESIFIGERKFKICLHESEYNRLRDLIRKDTEFLNSIGINRFQFFVVQKKVNFIIWNNLFGDLNIIQENNNSENANTNDDNDNKDAGIKRYIFKSVKNYTIYCISITGYFNNFDN